MLVLTGRFEGAFLPDGPPTCRCSLEATGDLWVNWGGAARLREMFGFGAGFLTPGRSPDADEGGLQVGRLLVLNSKGLNDVAGESERVLPASILFVPRGLLRGERGSWGAEDCPCCPFPVDASSLLRLQGSGFLGAARFFMISNSSRKARR